jgi:hypothetical protein
MGLFERIAPFFYSTSMLIAKRVGSETRAGHSVQKLPVDKRLEKGG